MGFKMNRRSALLIPLLLLGCGEELANRDVENESVQSVKLDDNFKITVQGGSILKVDKKQNPPIAYVRSQSFDLRIETVDQACQPRAITFVLSNLPERGIEPSVRVLMNAPTPETVAASAALGGGLSITADENSKNATPITADIPYELAREEDLYTVTVVSDRNRMSADLLPGRPGVLDGVNGACARLTQSGQGSQVDESALILRQRIHIDPPPEGYAFAVFGNNQSHKKALSTIIDQITEQGDIAFTLITGDLYGSDGFYSVTKLTEELDRLPSPWFATLGDHDVSERSAKSLIKAFGQSSFAFDWAPVRFIVLDSASATFSSETHSLLETWLKREPLYWSDVEAPGEIAVFTHYAPFDPNGARNDGFKHRLEAARVIANLERADVHHLFTSHLSIFDSERQGKVEVIHAGGAGAPISGGGDHFWLRVEVNGACSNSTEGGAKLDEACGECEAHLACTEGRCKPCITYKPQYF